MIALSEHEKRVLSVIGHGPYGKELVDIIRKLKSEMCSLETIERGTDYNNQIEGRLIFKELAESLIEHFEAEQRTPRKKTAGPKGDDDFS